MNKKLLLQVALAAGAASPSVEPIPSLAALEEPAFAQPAMPVLRPSEKARPARMPVLRYTDNPKAMPMPVIGAKGERPALSDERLREVFDGTRKPK